MSDDRRSDFKTTFGAWVEARQEGGSHHPAPEELRRFRTGELGEEAAETVRDHLVLCRDCLALVRSPAQEEASELERAAFWRSLKPRLAEIDADRQPSRPAAPVGVSSRRWRALAAALVVGVVGLSVWAARQQARLEAQAERLAELSQPRANAAIVDLTAGAARGGERAAVEVPGGQGLTLVLTPAGAPADGLYELAFVDEGGRRVLSVTDLRPDPRDGSFSLWLPPDALPGGPLRAELFRSDDTVRSPVETFRLRVAAPSRR